VNPDPNHTAGERGERGPPHGGAEADGYATPRREACCRGADGDYCLASLRSAGMVPEPLTLLGEHGGREEARQGGGGGSRRASMRESIELEHRGGMLGGGRHARRSSGH